MSEEERGRAKEYEVLRGRTEEEERQEEEQEDDGGSGGGRSTERTRARSAGTRERGEEEEEEGGGTRHRTASAGADLPGPPCSPLAAPLAASSSSPTWEMV
eukprot:2796710-Rhodomonas_salina.4